VRYEGDRTNEVDLVLKDSTGAIGSATNLMGRLSTLLLWHEQDPVDANEELRNDLIFERYQHNRNPFVDHPEWAALVFAPPLRIVWSQQSVDAYWPIDFTNAVLEASETVSGGWGIVTGQRTVSGNEIRQSHPSGGGIRFFRLKLR
jgi:hypothetical protein